MRVVAEARRLAAMAAEPVIELARTRTTVSVERATLRLAGPSGADPASFSAGEGAGTQPWVNTVVDAVRDQVDLQHGVALPVWHALGSGGPRFDVTAAGALGVDRVFGTGTTPAEVASYLAHRLRTGWDR